MGPARWVWVSLLGQPERNGLCLLRCYERRVCERKMNEVIILNPWEARYRWNALNTPVEMLQTISAEVGIWNRRQN